jgi:L-seryl-tRNA(Ser) seleniumtransferase
MAVMKALRQIPPVHEILERSELAGLGPLLSQPFAVRILERVMDELRARLRKDESEPSREELASGIAQDFRQRIEEFLKPSLRRVINATGVVLHTNLGRAPLPAEALDHVREVSASYSNLEFDIGAGSRGKRDSHVSGLLSELLGCESAIVVNNNAAAVLLVLNALADGGEVVVSRGEEIEIGGSFRIPEVMAKSGARLREIGTTNRTRIADYEAAIGPDTRLLLRVHPSNFTIVGFTERPSLPEFIELGRRSGVPTFEDLGSGCIGDLARAGVTDEPQPQESIEQGIDLICFSGDKLLGGPQAGIIAGRKALVDQVRGNPLFRALRVDKLTLGALEWVLLAHLRGDLDQIPIWRMLRAPESEVRDRAEALARRASNDAVRPAPLKSVVGGGSVPEAEIASWGLAINPDHISPVELERRLREGTTPVVVRIEDDSVLLDLRTVSRSEEDALLQSLENALSR